MRRAYREKLLEEFIRDFPLEFLNESLVLVSQQQTIRGFRPDLIFRDSEGRLVIVEVQLHALDRHHLYRTLEYRDLLMEATGCGEPRIILFCNVIRPMHERLLLTHRIARITVNKEDFLAKALILRPNLEVTETEIAEDNSVTVKRILDALQAAAKPDVGRSDPDALVFWFPPGFPHQSRSDGAGALENTPLSDLPAAHHLYFNTLNCLAPVGMSKDTAWSLLKHLPAEIIVGRSVLESLDLDQVKMIEQWLELLGRGDGIDGTVELVLGYRSCDSLYGYEWYIRGRIRRFEPIWIRYGEERGYDVARIRSDLSLLKAITFYGGKYPSLDPVCACSKVDVELGPGPLQRNLDRRRSLIQDCIARQVRGYSSETLESFDRLLVEDHDEWVTVRFHDLNNDALRGLTAILQELRRAQWTVKTDDVNKLVTRIGLRPPRVLGDIPTGALSLSAQYFFHLKRLT